MMTTKLLIILLLLSTAYSQVEQKSWGVTNKDTKLFNGNTTFGKKVIHTISEGDTLKIFDEKNSYYRIFLEKENIKKWGWVKKNDLKQLPLAVIKEKIIDIKNEEKPFRIGQNISCKIYTK